MTLETKDHAFFVELPEDKTSELVACALSIQPTAGSDVRTAQLSWAPRMAALFREVAAAAQESERPAKRSLPYASLRAALQVNVPEAVLLSHDLGRPWDRDDPRPLLAAEAEGADLAERASTVIGDWGSMVLRPWAERLGVDDVLVEGILDLAGEGGAFGPPDVTALDLGKHISDSGDFRGGLHAALQIVSRRLEGVELFEGLGPAYRVIRSGPRTNFVEFLAWPMPGKEAGRFSMVATLSVESAPFTPYPILVVRASRREWLDEIPAPRKLARQSSLRGYLLADRDPRIAVEFACPIHGGVPDEPFSPEYLRHALNVGVDVGARLAGLVGRQGSGGIFLGVPYSPSRDGRRKTGSGATAKDQVDLCEVVSAMLGPHGFHPLAVTKLPKLKKAPRREKEEHLALKVEALLAEVALILGRNDVGDEALRSAWEVVAEGEFPKKLNTGNAEAERIKLDNLKAANGERVVRAFGDVIPRLVFVAATEQERTTFRTAVDALFGPSIEVREYALPQQVHGARADLPENGQRALGRFAARVQAWSALRQVLAADKIFNHVIVQAVDWYDKRRDDIVNKLAGRYALASGANANVQYLRPVGTRQKDFDNYLHRVQAAVYDLLFGHSGLVSEIGSVVETAFPNPSDRPKALIGLSVVTQARTRTGGGGGKLCLATRVDVGDGRTTARVGWFDGGMTWSERWIPFFEALKVIAGPEVKATLGGTREVERTSFQAFVKTVVDEAVQKGDRPLILVDSTSAASLWSSLTDAGISGGLRLGPEQIDVSTTWAGARLVRVRQGRSGRLIEAKVRAYARVGADGRTLAGQERERDCPTIVEQAVRLSSSSGAAHYWLTPGYFQISLPRGLSVYRPSLPTMVPATKLKIEIPEPVLAATFKKVLGETKIDLRDESYRLPQSIDVTVALTQPGDDPDRIVRAVAMLRRGYGHTPSWTALPAPLSFESKARDYMTRFALEDADAEEEEGSPEGEDPPDGLSGGEAAVGEDPEDESSDAAPPDETDGAPPAEAGQPKDPPRPEGNEFRTETGAGATTEETAVGTELRTWRDYGRAPVLPVPSFVTTDWLRAKVNMVNSALREVHLWRGEIQELSGFPDWPDERPTSEEFLDLLVSGMRYPNFVRAVTQQAARSAAFRKRDRYNIFRPFVLAATTTSLRLGVSSRRWSEPSGLAAMAKAGEFDTLLGIIFLMSHGGGFDPGYRRLADQHPDQFAPLMDFIEVAEKQLPGRFDWDGHIIGLKGSPPTPPIPLPRIVQPVAAAEDKFAVIDDPLVVDPVVEVPAKGREEDVSSPPGGIVVEEAAPDPEPLVLAATSTGLASDPASLWSHFVTEAARIAKKAGEEPDGALMVDLRAAVAGATRAFRAWEAGRPRLVACVDLVLSAASLAADLGQPTADRPSWCSPERVMMLPAEQVEVTAEIEAVGALAAESERLKKDAQTLMREGDTDRLEEIGSLRDRAKVVAADASARIAAVLDRLDAAVTDKAPNAATVAREASAAPPHLEEPSAASILAPEAADHGLDDAGLELVEELAAEAWTDGLATENVTEAVGAPDDDLAARVEPVIDPPAPRVIDPIAEKIDRKLITLMGQFDVGLAHHLARAARKAYPDHPFVFDENELRFVAMAEHVNHAAMQGSDILSIATDGAFASSERLKADVAEELPQDVIQSRVIALFGAAASLVLFHPHTTLDQILAGLRLQDAGVNGALYQLRDVLVDASRHRVPLTPAMFRAATHAAAEDRHADECRDEVLKKVDAIGRLQFKFQLGTKIRMALVKSDGVLGQLQDAVRNGADGGLEAARAFAGAYADRASIISLFEEVEETVNRRRIQGIDGEARERLVSNITELAGLCLAFVQARDAAPALQAAGSRALVQSLREALLRGLEHAMPVLAAHAAAARPLPAAAAAYAVRALERLRGALDGKLSPVGAYDHLVAVHGALPWVEGLKFGRSWLPSPYEADVVARRIVRSAVPSVPTDARAFEEAVRARIGEDAFVAALLILEQGAFRSVDSAVLDRLGDYVRVNVATRRDKLAVDVADARRSVDRVQRLGSLVGADDGQDLLSLLDRIDPAEIPAFKEPGVRSEAEEEEAILDFAAAQSILDDVGVRVNHLLDRPRAELTDRLEALSAYRAVAQADGDRVRHLIERGDLLTAGEYLDFVEDGRDLPDAASPHPRFHAFFPAVPDHLARHGGNQVAVRDAITSGADLGPLAFSWVPEARREDTLKLYEDWLDLQRRVQAGRPDVTSVVPFLCTFLDRFGFNPELDAPDKEFTNPRKHTYAANIRLRLQKDPESVLLPRFGSLTGGNYRVVVLAKMPTNAEIAPFSNSSAQGVILFVMEAVNKERRQQLALACIEAQREILLIDEALVLFALSQGEFRPLTLIECAQPFSFGAPYRDYGSQAVPGEIFFGREIEFRKIVDPSGPCVVYGGRRLGKTALLQQVKQKEDNPAAGTVVAFVSIYGIGKTALPADIWAHISRQIPAIFREPAKSNATFSSIVEKWLDADSRRRVLVLLDEADEFIRADAAQAFREFLPLQRLMDTTRRRFKFVLAGLHNVTRLVHTENPPLKQIAADPQRIGPLMGEELKDAEFLVTRPLAALGFEFERREDVWRILSHCNYYPVLVQTFCKGLLDILYTEVRQSKRTLFAITSEHVRRALENESISKDIGEMFKYTLEIDPRYDLIANIMAERALADTAAGRVRQGMSSVEVVEAAARVWPAAFDQTHRLAVVEDLLDEMEGLGVLRRGPDDMWALRSNAILRLLGNETKIIARLIEFMDREAPAPFEPRSMRRELHLPAVHKVAPGHSCPLTLGQEHDLLAIGTGATQAPIHVIFGNDLSDVRTVGLAMRDLEGGSATGQRIEVVPQVWQSAQAMLDDYRNRKSDAAATLFVVDARTEWDPTWIATSLQSRAVRERRLSVAFVGGPEHALKWVRGRPKMANAANVRVSPLQLWSTAMIDHHLGLISAPSANFTDELRRLTGWFNRPMSQVIGHNSGPAGTLQSRIERLNERLLADVSIMTELGLVGPMLPIFERMQNWLDADGCITPYEISEAILREVPDDGGLTGLRVVEFGVLLSLLRPEATPPGTAEDVRRFSLNPLLRDALRNVPVARAA